MKAFRLLAGVLALALIGNASATVTLPQINNAGGAKVPAQGSVLIASDGTEIGNSSNPVFVSASGVQPLPSGAATAANQTTINSSLSGIAAQLPATLGQKASSASLPVVLASDQSGLPTSLDGVTDAVTTTGNASSAANVVSLSTVGFGGGSLQITSIGTGNTVTFEQSNDNANWQPLTVNLGGNTYSSFTNTATATGIYLFTANAAYVRARISTYGSGTVTIVATLKRQKPVGDFSTSTVIGTGNSPIGSTINGVGYTDSTTALGGSATYTGTSRATTGLAYATKFKARVITDQAGTLYIEQSVDSGSNYRVISTTAVTAGTAATASAEVTGAYASSNLYRVRFVNGASAQGYFNLSSAFASS